ncbi:MAG: UDP-glucose/GDP-mannose dehydrogenase family protein [Armatimonadetes bacterium]|nr:UDP-glucose/GDP-mannose dehydrogenase family protein [Armatimonadota bacterium]MBS1725193.1 UDP-glucose/GDP-mannose dehydrogenase family protein [Armatimonadota bacterium]
MKVAVVGTGYVGLVTGLVLADLGNEVICVDKDQNKLAMIRSGIPPIYEPGLEEMLKRTLKSGHFKASDSIKDAVKVSEVVFIAVGTPPGPDGTPDLSAVRAVATEIGKSIDKHTVVVNKSTVPVGSGDMVEMIIREQGVVPTLYDVVSNPEFLREGSAIQDTLRPDRIVIGSKRREAALKLMDLYAPLQSQIIVTDLNSAELIKYGANSFLAMKISFINALSRVCEMCDANIVDVAQGIGSDSRIGKQFLNAGLGWGGSCFPKDVQGMVKTAEGLGYDFDLLNEVIKINDEQTINFLNRIESHLDGFKGKTIGLLGLAFKPNTDDIRDAKSLIIIEEIAKRGGTVRAYDPVATDNVRELYPNVAYCESAYDVSEGADAVVVVTEWNEFKNLDFDRLGSHAKGKVLYDGRRIYNRRQVEGAGWTYHTIGSR